MTTNGTAAQPANETMLRPVIGLTQSLPKSDLLQITIDAIKVHRRLRDIAEARYEEMQSAAPVDPDSVSVGPAHIAYVMAMIDMHAQQTVLSTLIDVLGYIPKVSAG